MLSLSKEDIIKIAEAVKSVSQKKALGFKIQTPKEQQQKLSNLMTKEAKIARWLQTENGLKTLASNLANPVRYYLDYKSINRKFVTTEQIPESQPMYFDRDYPNIPALVTPQNGSVRMTVGEQERVYVPEFVISANPKIPYQNLYQLKFKPIARTKDKLISGLQMQEDLLWFGMMETVSGSSSAFNTPVISTSGAFDKQDLATAFARVEDRRLMVANVLMSAYGIAGIRGWQFQDLDQTGMQEVRETGYLGNMWNANFWVSDQIEKGDVYIVTSPDMFGWQPIRKDVQIIPANDPNKLQLGFVGFEQLGQILFNPYGISKLTFTPNL